MKKYGCALAIAGLLLAAIPAQAEVSVVLVNKLTRALGWTGIETDSGSMSGQARVVPGNRLTQTIGNAKQLQTLKMDTGLMLYTFENLNISEPKLTLGLALQDGVPVLLPEGAAPAEGAKSGEIEVPAGPLWDHDHATKRCPEVLAAWKAEAENAGKSAVWEGGWTTTIPGEMSVCKFKVTSASAEGQAKGGGGKAIPGKAVSLVGEKGKADFEQLLAVKNVDELRALGTVPSHRYGPDFFLPVNFAQNLWGAFITPDTDQQDSGKPMPMDIALYADADGKAVENLIGALTGMKYRLWFAQIRTGATMNVGDKQYMAHEDPMPEKELVEFCQKMLNEKEAAALELLYIPESVWDRFAAGEETASPAILLRVTPGGSFLLQYIADAGSTIMESRSE